MILSDFDKTGQLELIEFTIRREIEPGKILNALYAVNVAKVREVIRMPKINQLASQLDGIAGVIELRNVVVPVIDLSKVFGDAKSLVSPNSQVIITEFSQKRAGFIVDQTTKIRRMQWDSVLPPPVDSSSFINGMVLLEPGEFLFILDLEKILFKIEAIASGDSTNYGQESVNARTETVNVKTKPKNGKTLLVVDDSNLILGHMSRVLDSEGYRIVLARNGKEALELIEKIESGHVLDVAGIDGVITDIEMPLLDGTKLTELLRKKDAFKDIPIILHSSLDGKASKEVAKKAGATTYVVKNNIADLIQSLEELLSTKKASGE